jgi:hypothetical protein
MKRSEDTNRWDGRDVLILLGVLLLAVGLGAYDWKVAAVVVGALFLWGGIRGSV